jgi:hypothetical protein
MQKRKEQHEARRARAREREEEEVAEVRVVEEKRPDVRIIKEEPQYTSLARPMATLAESRAASEALPTPTVKYTRGRSLDEVLFANPKLSAGAKLVLASEILGRPKSLRRSLREGGRQAV